MNLLSFQLIIGFVAGLVSIDQAIAAPQNDNFADRLPVLGSTLYATNCGATKERGEPNHAGVPGGSSLWWSWTANNSGGVRILSGPRVIIAVYTGTRVDLLNEIASGRDSLLFYAREGTAYAIAVDTAAGLCGNVTWSTHPEFAPSNDRFADRLPLAGTKVSLTVANEVAGNEPGEPYHAGTAPYRSLWWSWTAPETGRFAVSGEGYAFPARVAIYSGDQLGTLAPIVAQASPAPQKPAQTTFNATAGVTYAIAVDSIGEGATLLKLILSAAADNDDYANATELGNGAGGSTFGATREPGEPTTGVASVWYRWTAPATRGYALKLHMPPTFSFPPVTPGRDGPTYAGIRFPVIGVFRGNVLVNLMQLASTTSAQGTEATLSLSATAGVTYFVAVSEELGFMSDFTLTVQPGPPNDDFADATSIAPGQSLRFTNLGATREPGEPAYSECSGGASLWWKWTAPTNGTFAFDASFDEGQTVAVIYTGNSLTNLQPMGIIAPNHSIHPITIHALAGETYWFEADECEGRFSSGTATLIAAPLNDNFDHRQTLLTSRSVEGSNFGATHELGEPDHGNGTNSASVWWTWTAPTNGIYAIHDGNYSQLERVYIRETLASLEAIATKEIPVAQSLPRPEFDATGGTTYQIALDSVAGHGWGFLLLIFPVPPNDHFINQIVLAGSSNRVQASAANATREPGEPLPSRGESLWWSWVAPSDGTVTITSPNALTWLQVFTNRNPRASVVLSNLVYLTSTYGSPSYSKFVTASNVNYYLSAGSTEWTNRAVDFTLSFNALPPLIGQWSAPGLQLTTSPLNPWFRQTNTFFDAPDSAESGHAGGKLGSYLIASFLGPGELSYWWKIETPGTNENLYFHSVYWQLDILTGPRDWTRHTSWIGPGPNQVSWVFYPGARGGTAWVDRVEFVPAKPGAAVLALKPPNFWTGPFLQINGELTHPYRVETSTNLLEWTVWTNVVRTGLSWFPELPIATNEPVLFFRATTR